MVRPTRKEVNRHNPKAVLIEDKNSGTSLIQDFRREGCLRLIAINPLADKITRLSTQSTKVEAGQVYLPEWALWLGDFQAEMKRSPTAGMTTKSAACRDFFTWMDRHYYYSLARHMNGYMGGNDAFQRSAPCSLRFQSQQLVAAKGARLFLAKTVKTVIFCTEVGC